MIMFRSTRSFSHLNYANEEVKTIAASLPSLWKVVSQVCCEKKTAEEKETINYFNQLITMWKQYMCHNIFKIKLLQLAVKV